LSAQSIRSTCFLAAAAPPKLRACANVSFGQSAYIVRFSHDPQRDEIVIVRIWHGREERT
jgi:hypothetical protein